MQSWYIDCASPFQGDEVSLILTLCSKLRTYGEVVIILVCLTGVESSILSMSAKLFPRTRAWCMGLPVKQWLGGIVTHIGSQSIKDTL